MRLCANREEDITSTTENEAQLMSYPIICRYVSFRTACTDPHGASKCTRFSTTISPTSRTHGSLRRSLLCSLTHLCLDERVRATQLLLDLLNALGDEGRRISLMAPDPLDEVLQRFLEHGGL